MKSIFIVLVATVLTGLMAGCKHQDTAAEIAGEFTSDSLLVLTKDQEQTLNMQFTAPQQMNIPEIVYADGYISVPPQNEAMISPMVSGYVTAINFLEGQSVSKGMSVIRLKSPEVIDLQQGYLDQMNKFKYLENEYNRQKVLNENNVNARKIYLQSESDYLATKANLEAMRKKLLITGINLGDLESGVIISELNIVSPISGYVTSMRVMIGQHVSSSEVLFEVTDPDHLHAELNVFEKDASRVKPGQAFKLKVNEIEPVMDGRLFMVNKILDEQKRTVSVHGDFNFVEGILPGMYARAEIYVSNEPGWVLPTDAIYKGEDRNLIFEVIRNDDRVILKPTTIQTGREYGEFTEIMLPGISNELLSGKQFAVHGLFREIEIS